MKNGAKTYKKTAVKTATPEQVLLMLYEAAIKNAKCAREAIATDKVSVKCTHIGKTHDIVMELNNSLDRKASAEVVKQLESLYDYCISQLLRANMDNDLKAIESVIQVLSTLYDGWVVAVDEVRKQQKK